jgi:hypothetical protein
MSVTACVLVSVLAALAGAPASAVPSTTATIMWREFVLEGINLRIRIVHLGRAFPQLYGWKQPTFSLALPIF